MATDGGNDKPAGQRHVWGLRPVGGLVPALTRPIFKKRSPAAAQIMTDWAEIVGPALAAVTAPRRMSGSTLTLACSGPIALELQHMATELIARVNAHLGRVAVERLRFVQESLPAPAIPPLALPKTTPAPIEGLPPGKLNEALARLGEAVGRKQRRP